MNKSSIKYILLSLLFIWLFIFVLLPNLAVIVISFLHQDPQQLFRLPFTTQNYQALFDNNLFKVLLRSLLVAFNTTALCLIIAYPFSYFLARSQHRHKHLLVMLVIIPFWTSSLLRTYAIIALLKYHGLLNTGLLKLGIISQPLSLLYSNTAVYIGLVYALLPFMILALYSNMENLNQAIIDAAKDLGASRFRCFYAIILPMTLPGIVGGILLVFLPAMTLFYIPNLLGGAKSLLLGNLIENYFLLINDWPMGAACSVLLLVSIIAGLIIKQWRKADTSREGLI